MAETDLKVIVKAKELAVHSFKLTSNCNRYPKKYRHSLVDRIQIKSLDVYETLLEANRIDSRTRKWDRCETITRAITLCDELLFYIELSMNLECILIDRWNFVDQSVYLGSGQFSEETTSPWCDIVLWSPMPKESTASALPAPADVWLPLEWVSGRERPRKPLRAIAQFDVQAGTSSIELILNWTGTRWEFRTGSPVDFPCVRWFPIPSDEAPCAYPLNNNNCKTGMSPTGHCGAAAYCSESVDCCLNCDKDCNSRCGHMEV